LREYCCLALSYFCIEIYASGIVLGLGFQFPVPLWLGFYEGLYRKGHVCALMHFRVSIWWDKGLIVFSSASYSQGARFYTLFHLE
jgi:hypothetical protein